MKKAFLLFLFLNLSVCSAQSKGFYANPGGYLEILDNLTKGITKPGYAIYINDYKVTEEDKDWLNMANEGDFTSAKVFNKKQAEAKFGKNGGKGAIQLTPFTDPLLDVKYYLGINNMVVLNQMIPLLTTEAIQNNPVFVVDGRPLRGDDIVNVINTLGEDSIYSISLIKKKTAFGLYGIRALPGVLIILTKEYYKKYEKESSKE